jgi:polyphosphate:AMP phosphotransferase
LRDQHAIERIAMVEVLGRGNLTVDRCRWSRAARGAQRYDGVMFEAAEVGQSVSKEDYEREVATLRSELLEAQQQLRAANFPVIIIIGGVDGAGKGETVNKLLEWLDPRFIETFALTAQSDEERERPPMWRFWRALPPRGRIGIFFGGWHTEPIVGRVLRDIKSAEFEQQLADIVAFERLLVEDGALLLKFWMHLSKARQKKRLKSLEKDPHTRWRVTDADWEQFELYDRFRKMSSEALRRTSTGDAPWTIVDASDRRFQMLAVGRTLLARLREQLRGRASPPPAVEPSAPVVPSTAPLGARTILSGLDLTQKLDDEEYERRLGDAQGGLASISRKAAAKGISTVVVMEGVDAAGKGGAVRRLTSALDARLYRVVPIAAPTEDERKHPYLWRFWRHVPRAGRFTIFDRSWYGRVLVERVERFCAPTDWQRAYAELNDFEEQLIERGVVVVKFWMHISGEEQLRRFRERESTPWKQFKITEEDWRNRNKWPDYEQAVNDMIERTSTEIAPWTIVESEDKRFARVKVLETVRAALERVV